METALEIPLMLSKLRSETGEWRDMNFPTANHRDQLLGVIEELGELSHAHLKEAQGIRGSAEEHQHDAKDAIGDLIIYLTGYAQYVGVNIADAYEQVPHPTGWPERGDAQALIFALSGQVGRLARGENTKDVVIQYTRRAATGRIIQLCYLYCEARGWDFLRIVWETWAVVNERNWQANPETGEEDYGL